MTPEAHRQAERLMTVTASLQRLVDVVERFADPLEQRPSDAEFSRALDEARMVLRQARQEPPTMAPSDSALQPTPTGTEARVCADIAQRQALGVRKYGVTVEDNPLPLRAWLQHAFEETLDQAVYLKRAIEEMDRHG